MKLRKEKMKLKPRSASISLQAHESADSEVFSAETTNLPFLGLCWVPAASSPCRSRECMIGMALGVVHRIFGAHCKGLFSSETRSWIHWGHSLPDWNPEAEKNVEPQVLET